MSSNAQEKAAQNLFGLKNGQNSNAFSYIYRVTFGDTDAMKIMWHGSYINVLERARIAFLDETPFPYHFWESHHIHLPVLDLSIHYSEPFKFDDLILTNVNVAFKGVRIMIKYQCWPMVVPGQTKPREGGHLNLELPKIPAHTTAMTTHVAMAPEGDAKRLSHVLEFFKQQKAE